jgi:hypothetical protein
MIQAAARRRYDDARELPRVSYVFCQIIGVEEYFLLRKKIMLSFTLLSQGAFVLR